MLCKLGVHPVLKVIVKTTMTLSTVIVRERKVSIRLMYERLIPLARYFSPRLYGMFYLTRTCVLIHSFTQAHVVSIVSDGVDLNNVDAEIAWSDSEDDVLVDNLAKCIQEGIRCVILIFPVVRL